LDGEKRNDVVYKGMRRLFEVTRWDLFTFGSGDPIFFFFNENQSGTKGDAAFLSVKRSGLLV
jgi:hypothetical protein